MGDKNAPGGREAFRQAALQSAVRRASEDRVALPRLCICRWGDWIDDAVVPRRRMHVERVLYEMCTPEAEELCRQLTEGRVKGSRLFVSKYDKLPADAVIECNALDTANGNGRGVQDVAVA